MNVVDRVFPKEIRNFLKVACRYQRMNLIEDIFTAYDRYCDEQNQVLRRAYFHHGILCGAILLGDTSRMAEVTAAIQEKKTLKEMLEKV